MNQAISLMSGIHEIVGLRWNLQPISKKLAIIFHEKMEFASDVTQELWCNK